ncbi:MAG: glycosyltransferase family 39 protein [Anaerolineales bacterium]|nr:glycosyltransferase family 39 protein [Anaerolineales bacterium]MCX7754343.1 glycosyltransferase family 39 protein [Anaerolineales bacterium]MDW8279054.1 glycosyltransferase family 39 protein [Anaerolineales bacterium]
MTSSWLFGSRKTLTFSLLLAFLLALGIRLYDLSDLPLDFNPARQLFSMVKARGMYYAITPGLPEWQREIAIRQWQQSPVIEPPVIEALVAISYRLVGENLAVPRLYSILFWLVGGIFLFALAQKLTNPNGAFFALLVYLFLPFGIYASRSFQPDPLMVALIIIALWALWNWRETGAWRWAVAAGLLNGLAIFIKNVAVFPLALAAFSLVIERGWLASLKDRQTWGVAALSILPVALYTAYGVFLAGYLGGQFAFRFFPNLWSDPAFYLRWKGQLEGVFGLSVVLLALTGVFLSSSRRVFAFLVGLWTGYFLYSMTFAYHTSTHDYYQLPFIPIVALSLAPVAQFLLERAAALRPLWLIRLSAGLGLLLMVTLEIWTARVELARNDYRPDAEYFAMIGSLTGHTLEPVASVSQDYGGRLAYWGWQINEPWYDESQLALRQAAGRDIDLASRFAEFIQGKRFFVVTRLAEFENNPALREALYSHYAIHAEGRGFVIFDLTRPLEP